VISLSRAVRDYPVGSDLAYRTHRTKVLGHERDDLGFLCVRVLDGEVERLWAVDILAGSGVTVERSPNR